MLVDFEAVVFGFAFVVVFVAFVVFVLRDAVAFVELRVDFFRATLERERREGMGRFQPTARSARKLRGIGSLREP